MWKTRYATQIEWLLKINENVVFEKNKINNSGLMQKKNKINIQDLTKKVTKRVFKKMKVTKFIWTNQLLRDCC